MASPLEHLAEHDLLTGVFNRSRLVAELDRQLSYAARYSRAGALLALDLDNFKLANDTFGRAAGDVMLKAVSEILRARALSSSARRRSLWSMEPSWAFGWVCSPDPGPQLVVHDYAFWW